MSAVREWPIGNELVLERRGAGLFLNDRSPHGQVWPDRGREEARHRPGAEGVWLVHRPEQVRQLVWQLTQAAPEIRLDTVEPLDRASGPIVRASWTLAPDLLLELLRCGALGVVERRGGRGRVLAFAALGTGSAGLLSLAQLMRALLDVLRAMPKGGGDAP